MLGRPVVLGRCEETQKEDFGVMKCLPRPGMRGTVRQQGSQLGSSPLLALFQQGAEP